MLADFIILLHNFDEKPDRAVRVAVHNNIPALRKAVTRYNKAWRKKNDANDVLGICHRFEEETTKKDGQRIIKPVCAIVRLAPPHLDVDMIAHEMAHAAVWIRELDEGEDTPLNCQNDEDFCWILGELVRQTVGKFREKGLH